MVARAPAGVFLATMRVLAALLLLLLAAVPARAQDTLVLLDVSNSMLGRVDGQSRLSVARDVIEALANGADARARLGLMAFSHRRPADCEDTELLVAPGPVSARVFARLANPLVPRGRTAIAHALQEAARVAPRVLLITDGGDNCVPDPCAEVRTLKARHPALVVQVLGLDVVDTRDAAELRCIAEATGGRYFPALSRFELAFAMAEAAGTGPLALPPRSRDLPPARPGEPTLLTLEAIDVPGGAVVPVESWNLISPGPPRRAVLTDDRRLQPELRVPPGRYEVRLAAGNARVVERFEVEGARMTHRAVLHLGTLRPLGSLAAGRPARGGNWTLFADEVPGWTHGEQVLIAEGPEPVMRLTQGSYRLRFQTGEAMGEVPVFVEAGQFVSARVNLGAADITLLPSRGGRAVPAQAAEIRRAGETAVLTTSTSIRPRFVLPAGAYQARVRVEGVWRELALNLTAGQEAEVPVPLP